MKKALTLFGISLLIFGLFNSCFAYTDAEVEAKTAEIKGIVKLIFTKQSDKEKYQYVFKDIFAGCAKTCKNELSKLASAKIIETYDEDFLDGEKEATNTTTYKLDSVVDGDTIKIIDEDGVTYSVRMIGLDSPESYATRYGFTECFGKEASEYLKSLLKDIKEVQLELDATQGETDKYGRLLAYVFVNGENINKKMIVDGYGWEYTYNLPYKYQTEFKEAMSYAENNDLGLWNVNTCNGERIEDNTEGQNQNGLIKGNINNKGEKIYHLPGCSHYEKTVITESKGEKWFSTTKEAEESGWRACID